MPQPTKSIEQLPCLLTPEELLVRGKMAAALGVQIHEKKEAQKAAAAAAKIEIERLENEQVKHLKEIHTGNETRPIECFERPRYDANMVDVVREDTGTVIRSRPLHPSEKQLALEVGEAKPGTVTPIGKVKSKKKTPPQETNEPSPDDNRH
jgi:hypothetical protein